ncbi:hypothetical protein VDG1235_2211 [Verrucomicrobiia bacterium DG1235]|nr:hypothetical protein VDG1235_2211 [Verrucomicrobiae bacterium DG1235]
MQNFTDYGLSVINDIANRYGISNDAVIHMLYAVSNGGGTMAQFNCPELGGGGQWMQGGMTMVGDMFNNGLKNTVDNICSELSTLLYNESSAIFVPVKKRPAQSGQQQGNSIYISGNQGNWWGDDLGIASSTGGQNNIRYAVFPQSHRLAIEINGRVTVYDTLDHQIGGVSQQQSGDASMSFTSQYGLIQVSQLPIVSIDGVTQKAPPPMQQPIVAQQQAEFQAAPPLDSQLPPAQPTNVQMSASSDANEQDIFNKIERLAALKEKGILTDEEFSSKKAELLQRL